MSRPRLPFEPLARYALLNTDCSRPAGRWDGELVLDIAAFAEHIGIGSRWTIHKWVKHGVPFFAADEAAIRLGTHPLLIWPEWAEDPECTRHGTGEAVNWHRTYAIPMCEPCNERERARQRAARLARAAL